MNSNPIVNRLKALAYVPYVRHCSQTLYQAAIGALRLATFTGDTRWADRARIALDILVSIQQEDGGFDIGYDFNFGAMHKRGESTAPEQVALIALTQGFAFTSHEHYLLAAHRAANWIAAHCIDLDNARCYVPYAPRSTRAVMVYNGTSFASSALGVYLGLTCNIPNRNLLLQQYHRMVTYIDSVMSVEKGIPGRFWYYNDQTRGDLDSDSRRKVDYYHQMQQVEVHAIAETACPSRLQAAIIRDASDFLVALTSKCGIPPYTNLSQHIPTWGLVSVMSGLLFASEHWPERKEVYYERAQWILDWLLKYAWMGNRFCAVLSPKGEKRMLRYMVRSDAWVFASCASAFSGGLAGISIEVMERCWSTMAENNFSGPEYHASNRISRLQSKCVSTTKRFIDRIRPT